jgi:hypothetical protein
MIMRRTALPLAMKFRLRGDHGVIRSNLDPPVGRIDLILRAFNAAHHGSCDYGGCKKEHTPSSQSPINLGMPFFEPRHDVYTLHGVM